MTSPQHPRPADSKVELLPCPFCGGHAELWRAHPENPARKAWIACMSGCVVLTKEHPTDADAIAAWNRRPTPQEAREQSGGWRLVPCEPTEEMNEAAKPFRKGVGESAERLYRAMLSAAPPPLEGCVDEGCSSGAESAARIASDGAGQDGLTPLERDRLHRAIYAIAQEAIYRTAHGGPHHLCGLIADRALAAALEAGI